MYLQCLSSISRSAAKTTSRRRFSHFSSQYAPISIVATTAVEFYFRSLVFRRWSGVEWTSTTIAERLRYMSILCVLLYLIEMRPEQNDETTTTTTTRQPDEWRVGVFEMTLLLLSSLTTTSSIISVVVRVGYTSWVECDRTGWRLFGENTWPAASSRSDTRPSKRSFSSLLWKIFSYVARAAHSLPSSFALQLSTNL